MVTECKIEMVKMPHRGEFSDQQVVTLKSCGITYLRKWSPDTQMEPWYIEGLIKGDPYEEDMDKEILVDFCLRMIEISADTEEGLTISEMSCLLSAFADGWYAALKKK